MEDYKAIKLKVLTIIEKYAFNKELVRNAVDESRIVADLKINSARIVDIILDVEEMFDITIDDNHIEKMITVKDSVNIIISAKKG